MPVDYDIVLQTERGDGTFGCRGFSGVPAASRSWIAITSTGSEAGRKSVADLALEIETALLASSPEVGVSDLDDSIPPSAMEPSERAGRLKLLVLVGDKERKFTDQSWYHHWDSDRNRSGVMILLPSGKYEDFFEAGLPDEHLLHRINTASWLEKTAEVLPAVFGRAEVTSSISRIFISYRRVETLELALQLFDRLVHEGFDVFLDRFSIPPGYDFQRRLTEDLEDKSMVVLLESRLLKTSKWTQHEIDFAKRRRLGMLALQMPDVTSADVLASVTPDLRERLAGSDFAMEPLDGPDHAKQWRKLTDEALDRVVAEIKKAHADALFRRRHRLRTDLVAALGASGVEVEYQAVGVLKVPCGDDEHVVWPTTRPPEVSDFRSVHDALLARKDRSGRSCAIIVGPLAALEPDRKEQLEWLREVSHCRSFDEGELLDFARQLAAGSLQ
jgi:hypothetical protein